MNSLHSILDTLPLQPQGRFVATGQGGKQSDVLLWDVESRRLLTRYGTAICPTSRVLQLMLPWHHWKGVQPTAHRTPAVSGGSLLMLLLLPWLLQVLRA